MIVNPHSEIIRDPSLMLPGRKPTTPVRVDRQHPFAPTDFWILNRRYGLGNLANQSNPFVPTGSYGWRNDNLYYDGLTQYSNCMTTAQSYNTTNMASNSSNFFLVSFTNYATTADVGIFSCGTTAFDSTPFFFFWIDAPVDNVKAFFDAGYKFTSNTLNRDGIKTVMAIQFRASGFVTIYLDFTAQYHSNVGPFANGGATEFLYLNSSYKRSTVGTVEYDYCYVALDTEYSDAEAVALMRDPYQFLVPA